MVMALDSSHTAISILSVVTCKSQEQPEPFHSVFVWLSITNKAHLALYIWIQPSILRKTWENQAYHTFEVRDFNQAQGFNMVHFWRRGE